MPPLVIPDTARVNVVWALSGQEYAVNVLHYNIGGAIGIGAGTATALAAAIDTAFSASNLDGWLDSSVELARVGVRDLRVANQPEYNAPLSTFGTLSGDILPLQTSLCITLRTALAGKSYRGRTYITGFGEGANTSVGTCDAVAATAAVDFMTDLMSLTVLGNTWTLGVMSPTLGEINDVVSVEARDAIWDTQRRRSYPGI